MSSKQICLTLSRKELRTLAQIAVMAEWITGEGEKIPDRRFAKAVDKLAQRIYELAVADGNDDIAYLDESGRFESEPAMAIENSPVRKVMRAYDKEVYEQEFARQLFTNAAIREVGEATWRKLPFEAKLELLSNHEERIGGAIARHGLDAVVVTTADPAQ